MRVVVWIALSPGTASGQHVPGRFVSTPERPRVLAANREPSAQSVPLVPTEVMELGELTSEELSRRPTRAGSGRSDGRDVGASSYWRREQAVFFQFVAKLYRILGRFR